VRGTLRRKASDWARFTPRDIYSGTYAGALNQINCGTTTLVDWCHDNPTPEHTDAAVDAE
jgi:hypothetical protein